jgi:hypothetical protein
MEEKLETSIFFAKIMGFNFLLYQLRHESQIKTFTKITIMKKLFNSLPSFHHPKIFKM